MNPEQLLNEAEYVMLTCTDHSAYRYELYIHQHQLCCSSARFAPKEAIHIFTLTRQQIKHGLTPDEWNQLADKMASIYKELNL